MNISELNYDVIPQPVIFDGSLEMHFTPIVLLLSEKTGFVAYLEINSSDLVECKKAGEPELSKMKKYLFISAAGAITAGHQIITTNAGKIADFVESI